MLKRILASVLIIVAAAGIAEGSVKISVMGKAGYFLPSGSWTDHRYAQGIKQFRGSYTVSPEFELRFGDIGICAFYTFSSLNTSDWEDYVTGQGESITASGSIGYLGATVRYYPLIRGRHSAHIEGGMSYLYLSGDEQYRGYSYEYDFLESGVGFIAGAGYHYAFNERLSLLLPVRFVWKPDGVKYPAGGNYGVVGFLFTPGLKLTF